MNPQNAIVLSNSDRRISNINLTPLAPSYESPQNSGRPTKTPFAPSAIAIKASDPRRTPESKYTSSLFPTACNGLECFN